MRIREILISTILLTTTMTAAAQNAQNDANTPLHLLTPNYTYRYGVPKADEVKKSMDRIKD